MPLIGARRALLTRRIPYNWVSQFVLPSGPPSAVLDFMHGRYYDGVSNNASRASMLAGSPTVNSSGLLASSEPTATGKLLAALQATAKTIVAQVSGGTAEANGGILTFTVSSGYGTTPIFQAAADVAWNYLSTGGTLATANTADWTKVNVVATGMNSVGRQIILNLGPIASDSSVVGSPITATFGVYGGHVFSGYIQKLIIYPRCLSASEMQNFWRMVPIFRHLPARRDLLFRATSM